MDDILNRITVTRANFTIQNMLKSCELEQENIDEILSVIESNPYDCVYALSDHQKRNVFGTAVKMYFKRCSILAILNPSFAEWSVKTAKEMINYIKEEYQKNLSKVEYKVNDKR